MHNVIFYRCRRFFYGIVLMAMVGIIAGCHTTAKALWAKSGGKDTLRILAIGNSFSADALETHLHGIADAAGVPMIIANLAAPGAPLDFHVRNMASPDSAYIYTKILADGTKSVTPKTLFSSVLNTEQWNYVSFQQVSSLAGKYETFEKDLPTLVNYVKNNIRSKKVKYIMHQTWAYQNGAVHPGFANYDRDQLKMYYAVVDVVNRAAKLVGIDIIVPAGTAVQNARTFMGDSLTVDGYHLQPSTGRYVAAATWFEKLTHVSVIGNKYAPKGVTATQLSGLQLAAHNAVKQPSAITDL